MKQVWRIDRKQISYSHTWVKSKDGCASCKKCVHLSRGQGAGIDNVFGLLLHLFAGTVERRSGQSHETCSGTFEDTERRDELHE